MLAHQPGVADQPVFVAGGWSPTVVDNLPAEIASIRRLMRDPRANAFPLPIEMDAGRFAEIFYSRREMEALRGAAIMAAGAGNDADVIARGIVLHTDAAILGGGTGTSLRYTDGQEMKEQRSGNHWGAARVLANMLDNKAGRNADLALWFRASLAYFVASDSWDFMHAASALRRFPDDAELQFLAGCKHETLAAPRTQASLANTNLPPRVRIGVRSTQGELEEARDLFKRAIDIDARHDEARLHYGRLLMLTGRAAAAIPELRRALPDAREPEQKYFGQLFLGAALEAANQPDAARSAYQQAAALFPQAQAPRLALSHLSASRGDRQGAAQAIEPLLSQPPRDEGDDPWWSYLRSCGRSYEELMTRARRQLATPRPAP